MGTFSVEKQNKKVHCPDKGKGMFFFLFFLNLLEIYNNVEKTKIKKKFKAKVKKQDGGLWGKEGGCCRSRKKLRRSEERIAW